MRNSLVATTMLTVLFLHAELVSAPRLGCPPADATHHGTDAVPPPAN
jgi:hypothetical protein